MARKAVKPATNGDKIVALAPFKPEEWQIAPWLDKSPTLLLWGPRGGGKSYLAAEKLFAIALRYPGVTVVASRKKFDDMDQSTIPLIRDTVADCDNNPRATYRAREARILIDHGRDRHGNILPRSELLFTGMFDDKSRTGVKSLGSTGAIAAWWFEEGIEFEEEDYDVATAALRSAVMPWTQMIVTTNPGPTLHWINRRLLLGGEASAYYSDYTMNSHNPAGYGKRLAQMKGVTRTRDFLGKWADGVGTVISSWVDKYNPQTDDGAEGNVTREADYMPGAGDVFWWADDGYSGEMDKKTGFFTAKSQPRVFLLCQKTAHDTIHVFDEHYAVQTLQGEHIQQVLEMSEQKGYPRPAHVVHDGAAPSLGGALRKADLNAIPIRCKIDEGNKELREWAGPDQNGVRRLKAHPRCKFFRLEMGSYTYDKHGVPIDAFNHGPDAATYGVWYESYGMMLQGTAATYPGVVDEREIDERIALAMERAMARIEEKYNAVP